MEPFSEYENNLRTGTGNGKRKGMRANHDRISLDSLPDYGILRHIY
jgi:hypothetical protein